MVVYVMMEIVENLGLELAVDDFYDHPTGYPATLLKSGQRARPL